MMTLVEGRITIMVRLCEIFGKCRPETEDADGADIDPKTLIRTLKDIGEGLDRVADQLSQQREEKSGVWAEDMVRGRYRPASKSKPVRPTGSNPASR